MHPLNGIDRRLLSRRRFLSLGIGSIAGLIGAALGIPLVGYAVSPALSKSKIEWLEVGPVKDFATGIPQKAEYTQLRRDGWIEETVKKAVWILTKDGQQFTAYDPRCTHLGCAYSWQADRNRFFCPCHDGIYDVDGRVIGGPPPRPLDRYETKVENGMLYIGMMYRLNANLERVS
ncbi:MAG: ubiquinol-cytochrome c reductase iron-sulfur subunit [Chloroflexi bacterium]|nr:ubiquinol-cytochrome c reductase iron-sulfur subunit [Chloroflexota bacterium]